MNINLNEAKTAEVQNKIGPNLAIELLKEGNSRFLQNQLHQRDNNKFINQTSTGQYPFAAILSCIDSRVPAELVFDQHIGDLFNVRIAGNFINTDILGSLEFSCKVAGAKLIVVMGHTSCGAVKGACDDVKLGNLTSMLENLKPAVEQTESDSEDRSSANINFVNDVAMKNVLLSMQLILEQSPVLNEMFENEEIGIVGAIYDVKTGKVEFHKINKMVA